MPHVFKGNLKTFQGAPRIQNSPAYFSIRDWGYILGGDIGPQYTAELHYYNATTDEWRAMLPHPEGPVKWQTAVVHDRSVEPAISITVETKLNMKLLHQIGRAHV